ncbi:MAG: adenylyltransferase/cytidyltransferase family protein [Paracoccaceae bacterium]
MKKIIGYTSGVFDLFHVGHLNVLRNAKSMCDHLIVGVSTDELVQQYKNKTPVIPFLERCEIVRHCQFVDTVVAQTNMDKVRAMQMYSGNLLFVGDDWHGSDKWNKIEIEIEKIGGKVVYFPYTASTSSTKIKDILDTFK